MDNFAGKVAVITGAGSGFGRELARIASQLSMNLVLADVQRDALDSTAAEMQAAGDRRGSGCRQERVSAAPR